MKLQKITQGLDLPPKEEQPFRKPTDPLWQPVPLLSGLVSYSLDKPLDQRTTPVPFDPIHRFGMFPYREVLSGEELKKYPVVLLGYIDPQNSAELVAYLLAGGYTIADLGQLAIVEVTLRTQLTQNLSQPELNRQTLAKIERLEIRGDDPRYQEYYQRLYETQTRRELDARVQRIDIWSGHPLLKACYAIDQLYPTGHVSDPPLRGLEVDGRLVAVAMCQVFHDPLGTMIFADEVIFGLIQPSELGGRYTNR